MSLLRLIKASPNRGPSSLILATVILFTLSLTACRVEREAATPGPENPEPESPPITEEGPAIQSQEDGTLFVPLALFGNGASVNEGSRQIEISVSEISEMLANEASLVRTNRNGVRQASLPAGTDQNIVVPLPPSVQIATLGEITGLFVVPPWIIEELGVVIGSDGSVKTEDDVFLMESGEKIPDGGIWRKKEAIKHLMEHLTEQLEKEKKSLEEVEKKKKEVEEEIKKIAEDLEKAKQGSGTKPATPALQPVPQQPGGGGSTGGEPPGRPVQPPRPSCHPLSPNRDCVRTKGIEGAEFPSVIGSDSQGRTYTISSPGGQITVFERGETTSFRKTGADIDYPMLAPTGLHVDDNDQLYVTDRVRNALYIFPDIDDEPCIVTLFADNQWRPIEPIYSAARDQFEPVGGFENAADWLRRPWDVAVDSEGHICLGDAGSGRSRVLCIEAVDAESCQGEIVAGRVMAIIGQGSNPLRDPALYTPWPVSIAFDHEDHFWIANYSGTPAIFWIPDTLSDLARIHAQQGFGTPLHYFDATNLEITGVDEPAKIGNLPAGTENRDFVPLGLAVRGNGENRVQLLIEDYWFLGRGNSDPAKWVRNRAILLDVTKVFGNNSVSLAVNNNQILNAQRLATIIQAPSSRITDVIFDHAGRVLVGDGNNGLVFRLPSFPSTDGVDLLGIPLTSLGTFNRIGGIAAGSGKVWIAEMGNHRVQVLEDATLNPLRHVEAVMGSLGTQPGQFNMPQSISLLPGGELVVSDVINQRIQIFPTPHHESTPTVIDLVRNVHGVVGTDTNGLLIATRTTTADNDRELWQQCCGEGNDWCFDNVRNVSSKIQGWRRVGDTFVPSGSPIAQPPQCYRWVIGGMALDPQRGWFCASDTEQNRIVCYETPADTEPDIIGKTGRNPVQFRSPKGLAFDREGRLWVADAANNRFQVIPILGIRAGSFVLGTPIVLDRENTGLEFSQPQAVSITAEGKIFLADQFRVYAFQ